MKKIVCELCEGTQFVKENGMFVCQGCGTSYSLEEAKGMMKDVEGDDSSVQATPAQSVPQSSPQVNNNQQQLDNILLLASSAYEADNKSEAENYCNQAIVIDATCYKAWFLKGKAVGWQSSIANLRIEEAAHSFCKAIDFAPEEEKEELKNQSVEELKNLGLALIALRAKRFSEYPDEKELIGFTTDRTELLKSLTVLLQHGNAVGMPEGYTSQIATLMNQAAVAGFTKVRNDITEESYPSEYKFKKYLAGAGNCIKLLQQSIDACDDDDEEDIQRYKNLIIVLEDGLTRCSYKEQWNSFTSSFMKVKEYELNDEAKAQRRKQIQECKDAIAAIERKKNDALLEERKKAEEERLARIAAYWETHADEKTAYDTELKELEARRDVLRKEVLEINNEISKNQPSGKVPSEEESDRLKVQISELNARKNSLGVLAGKEKKQIGEEIASLEGRLASLQNRIYQEQKDRVIEANNKNAPLTIKRNELNGELSKITQRVDEINKILQKDPEE